jgi:hypothetical protein
MTRVARLRSATYHASIILVSLPRLHQGLVGLAELVQEVNVTRLALDRTESQLCEAQRLLPAAEAQLAELDAQHRALVDQVIRPLRTAAAEEFRRIAAELKLAPQSLL